MTTLCLVIAGQPADVFNFENRVDSSSMRTAQPPVAVICKYHCCVVLSTPICLYGTSGKADVPAEEPPLPPPPTYKLNRGHAANGFADAKTSNALELSSGMPPMPPTQNQFSARGRMGVRSR